MQEAISCFCVVINNITHDFRRAVGLLRSCLSWSFEAFLPFMINGFTARLGDAKTKYRLHPTNATLNRQLQLLVCMVALLGENCDMDRIRQEQPGIVN
jgi:cohesin loading factor subunit SCC2